MYWQRLGVGAGGFLSGIDTAADGTIVVRADTYGAYIWNGSKWQQLVTYSSLPASVMSNFPYAGVGVYEIRIAPSDTKTIYMMYSGYLLVSHDQGKTFSQTSFTQIVDDANDGYRGNGEKMAVDPINSNIVYAGTPLTGLFTTSDAGKTWTNVSSVPVSVQDAYKNSPGMTGIVFDPSLGSTNGKTNSIYVSSYGNGVYQSKNAGASFSLLPGSPTGVHHAIILNGVYYATNDDGTHSSLWKYDGSSWTKLLEDWSGNVHAISVNPANQKEFVIQAGSGAINVSYDSGATWSGFNGNANLHSTDIQWLQTTGTWLTIGAIAFDPKVPNQLLSTAGVGVWQSLIPPSGFTSSSPISMTSRSIGIEQLCPNELTVGVSQHPILSVWDQGVFTVTNPKTYTATHYPGNQIFSASWSMDHASSDSKYIAAIIDWNQFGNNENSAYSTDGGMTWSHFASVPPDVGPANMGGVIAVSTPTNIIWAPANKNVPYYTLDGGKTWNAISLPGISDWSGYDWAYYLQERTVVADRVLPNTFYFYYSGKGLFTTTDGGVSWTQTYSGNIASFDYFSAKMQAVPGKAGELYFTAGILSGTAPVSFGQFLHSVDGGKTWNPVPNVLEVTAFGFGAPKVSGQPQVIFIAGWVNGVYGIWQSDDSAGTWTKIGDYPLGDVASVVTISGDPAVYGEVYLGLSGDGFAFYGP